MGRATRSQSRHAESSMWLAMFTESKCASLNQWESVLSWSQASALLYGAEPDKD